MKKLPIYDPEYKQLLADFTKHLAEIGYGESAKKKLPRNVREFLYTLEKEKVSSIENVKPEHIENYYSYLQERPSERKGALNMTTVDQHLYAVRIFLAYLEQIGKLKSNPLTALHFNKSKSKARTVLDRAEIKALYRNARSLRDQAILAIFYGCGLRRSEAEKLNTKDISFKTGLLYVREGKGKKRRVIPMSSKVIEDLRNYYIEERSHYITKSTSDNKQAFILNDKGNRMRGETYNKHLKRLLKASKIEREISLHHLRHSIATHLLENGLIMEKVREFLGHEQLDTTQIYTHINKHMAL